MIVRMTVASVLVYFKFFSVSINLQRYYYYIMQTLLSIITLWKVNVFSLGREP